MLNRGLLSTWMAMVTLSGAAALVGGGCEDNQPSAQPVTSPSAPGATSAASAAQTLAAPAASPAAPAHPADDDCWWTTGEEGGPQSREYKGGCVERMYHFYAENGVVPPAELPAEVVGVRWSGRHWRIKLKVAKRDQCIPGYEVPLYEARAVTDKGEFNICTGQTYDTKTPRCADEAESLREMAIAVPGAWDYHGNYVEEEKGKKVFTLSCATGVAAKCVHWGYAPWRPGEGSADLYAACLKAARFERSRTSYTCQGRTIDIYDRYDIRKMDEGLGLEYKFEAAWDKDGIVCLGHTRYRECADMETFKDVPRCDPAMARKDHWPKEQGGRTVLIKTRSEEMGAPFPPNCPDRAARCPGRTKNHTTNPGVTP